MVGVVDGEDWEGEQTILAIFFNVFLGNSEESGSWPRFVKSIEIWKVFAFFVFGSVVEICGAAVSVEVFLGHEMGQDAVEVICKTGEEDSNGGIWVDFEEEPFALSGG